MARAATTLDPFNAVAKPRRRIVLGALAHGECPVNEMVHLLGWPQPQVSKHLGVLRKVGLVNVRREGRQRLYSVNGEQLKPIHDWVNTFERFWQRQLERIRQLTEEKVKATNQPVKKTPNPKE